MWIKKNRMYREYRGTESQEGGRLTEGTERQSENMCVKQALMRTRGPKRGKRVEDGTGNKRRGKPDGEGIPEPKNVSDMTHEDKRTGEQ